jgi:hypothetical protein
MAPREALTFQRAFSATYWRIPDRQIETSLVLARPPSENG